MIQKEIQIRFSDCDMLGHVNNAFYLQYFEISRMELFNEDLKNWDWVNHGIILLKNVIEYKQPLFLEDKCIIDVNCSHIGSKSFTLTYHLHTYKEGKKTLKTYGESVLVCYDFNKKETISIPEKLKSALEKHFVQNM